MKMPVPLSNDLKEAIRKWIEKHNAYCLTPEEIAKQMATEAINSTPFAEDAYPDIRNSLLVFINSFEFNKEDNINA